MENLINEETVFTNEYDELIQNLPLLDEDMMEDIENAQYDCDERTRQLLSKLFY